MAQNQNKLLKVVDEKHKETQDSVRQLSMRIESLSNNLASNFNSAHELQPGADEFIRMAEEEFRRQLNDIMNP